MLDFVLKFGLSAAPLVIGLFLYDRNPIFSVGLVIIGIIFIAVIIGVESNYRIKEANYKSRGNDWGAWGR